MSKPKKKIKIDVMKGADSHIIVAEGAFGALNQVMGTMVIYADVPYPPMIDPKQKSQEKKILREIQVVLKMPPDVWKSIAKWMTKWVKDVEKTIGEKLPERKGTDLTPGYIG